MTLSQSVHFPLSIPLLKEDAGVSWSVATKVGISVICVRLSTGEDAGQLLTIEAVWCTEREAGFVEPSISQHPDLYTLVQISSIGSPHVSMQPSGPRSRVTDTTASTPYGFSKFQTLVRISFITCAGSLRHPCSCQMLEPKLLWLLRPGSLMTAQTSHGSCLI